MGVNIRVDWKDARFQEKLTTAPTDYRISQVIYTPRANLRPPNIVWGWIQKREGVEGGSATCDKSEMFGENRIIIGSRIGTSEEQILGT